jgi:hypothetical protein
MGGMGNAPLGQLKSSPDGLGPIGFAREAPLVFLSCGRTRIHRVTAVLCYDYVTPSGGLYAVVFP